jgi:hypothetical protein
MSREGLTMDDFESHQRRVDAWLQRLAAEDGWEATEGAEARDTHRAVREAYTYWMDAEARLRQALQEAGVTGFPPTMEGTLAALAALGDLPGEWEEHWPW